MIYAKGLLYLISAEYALSSFFYFINNDWKHGMITVCYSLAGIGVAIL